MHHHCCVCLRYSREQSFHGTWCKVLYITTRNIHIIYTRIKYQEIFFPSLVHARHTVTCQLFNGPFLALRQLHLLLFCWFAWLDRSLSHTTTKKSPTMALLCSSGTQKSRISLVWSQRYVCSQPHTKISPRQQYSAKDLIILQVVYLYLKTHAPIFLQEHLSLFGLRRCTSGCVS